MENARDTGQLLTLRARADGRAVDPDGNVWWSPANGHGAAPAREPELTFRPLGAIAADDFTMTWTHRGWASHPSHGETAGPEKALKSWLEAVEVVCIAAGLPLFDRFPSVTRGPVLVFSGEVADRLYHRRVRHIGRSLGLSDVQIDALPIHVTDQRAHTRSETFQASLRRGLELIQPVRVSLDPLYSYHGSDVEASNVHASAEVRNVVSDLTGEHGASLRIVNHFRKDVHGRPKLVDITQAGGREWVDSWVLVSHRKRPNLKESRFWLAIEVGGRHWGGSSWDLDVSLGGFDEATFDWTGQLEFELQEHVPADTDEERERQGAAKLLADQMTLRNLGRSTWEQFGNAARVGERQAKARLGKLVKADMARVAVKGARGRLAMYEATGGIDLGAGR